MTAGPKPLITLWMTMLPTEIKLCWRILGTAITEKLPKCCHEKIRTFPSVRILRNLRKTTSSASTQLIPWHRKVAHTTPATPIRNAVTKRISTPMLESEEQARKINGVFDWSTSQESSSAPWFSYVNGNYVTLKVEKAGDTLVLYVNDFEVIIREFDFGDGDCVVGIFDFSLNLTAKNWSLEKMNGGNENA